MKPPQGTATTPPPEPTPDPISAHRTRVSSRIPIEPIGYDSQGVPLWPWQVMDGE